MKNAKIIIPEKFQNSSKYQYIEDGIYNDLHDDDGFFTYRIAIKIEVDSEKKSPEMICKQIESHFVYIEEASAENTIYTYILGGELKDLQKFKSNLKGY
ncbi:hypothetical protein U8527_09760 [Kordia algicida OT-1]|uniref:Uncharacterized protein n=1 Tax=Kordia algicida OT-1 TaxID=391587 RepID=A9DV78_9FLAO|nr:hypothetical protein [Kordia algicida]EDP96385.1 hypothetical protein KAOT1_03212 [Kordia algicida OT-1]